MKKSNKYLLLSLLLIPTMVFASTADMNDVVYLMLEELLCSLHSSIFFLIPLANLINHENSRSVFWKLFILRIVILFIGDFVIPDMITSLDFSLIFVGAFCTIPICMIKHVTPFGLNPKKGNSVVNNNLYTTAKANSYCPKCGAIVTAGQTQCASCKAELTSEIISATPMDNSIVTPGNYDPIFKGTDDILLNNFIKREMIKAEIDEKTSLIPADALKRKNIMYIIFCILLFIYISLIFFHFPIYTYLIGGIILIIFKKIMNKFNLMKYLIKEVKSRPQEKISNIVMQAKSSFVVDDKKPVKIIALFVSLLLPLAIFSTPKILYESVDGGYAVRFYAFGLTNFKTATIPAEHNGKAVVSLRGNTFSNMFFLTKVTLPDTITEIRGQAFKNDYALSEVNIPTSLEYLGGGAFYNCSSITEITLPDTLTYLGGESFYGASSLTKVKLSNQLSEIRGDTFEYCTSLEEIEIPDSVTRIGGHAFYGDSNLSKVTFTENSQLTEIGSSAFRACTKLTTITIPASAVVNYRAFKESPTKICIFGEECDVETLDTSVYAKNSFMSLELNEKKQVGSSNYYLELKNIVKSTSSSSSSYSQQYTYTIVISYNEEENPITLYNVGKTYYSNTNIAVSVSSGYEDHLYVDVYYNE